MTTIPQNSALPELIDRILDKGLVINADIKIDLAGTEILGIKLRVALASFETAAKFGLAFPSGTNLNAPAWKRLECSPEYLCPDCGRAIYTKVESKCTCGWKKVEVRLGDKKLLEMEEKDESNYPKSIIKTYRRDMEEA